MQRLIQVRLRESGQALYFVLDKVIPKVGDYVIVEAERGLDYGQVTAGPEGLEAPDKNDEPLKRVLRHLSPSDIKQIQQNRLKAKEAFHSCVKKIAEHKLDMKLVDAEYSFDKSKLIFYFTADGRIDFRNLVKDLAKIFRSRIELRQIGVRDEAKFFGGFGPCGRQLCCAKFLREFEPVTIKMAKEQNLPLNPTKISGLCGRLMCCLSYEHQTYKHLCKGLPCEGAKVTIPEGKGRVVSVNPLKRSAVVETEDGRHITVIYK
ncbi:MAG: stage 0 sporulation protein [Candidatus Omnitrophica bacterium CG11_big_fil_rev_8_21_14_0_20_42_13]|uniref:Stage 0 sporulation protein n=1 Tax=Candidatus Ghiorseimicrobium undicola TaxID=1974746 RepID=A0A2H0LW25_9BACT|nr:MAG: stage 0 sporulation protein [Candidatus Omnitrophica bacterium CG11_big_fil_rev_8_21_14_0_20_42_13]